MDALEQARSLLPWWVQWGPVLLLPAVFLVSWLIGWIPALLACRPLSCYDGDSWVERARLAWPARMAANHNFFLLMLFGAVAMLVGQGPLNRLPPALGIGLGALAGLLAAGVVAHQVRRRLGLARLGLVAHLRGTLTFLLIAVPQLPVLAFLLALMPWQWEWRAPVVLLAGVLLLTWLILGGGLWLGQKLGNVRPASARLADLVERTAERMGIRPRAAYEAELGFSNAFALPPTKSLLIARSLLENMSDDEMIAILAHELAHLGESRAVTMVRVAATFLLLPLGAAGLIYNALDLYGLLGMVLLIVLGMLGVVRLARRMEEEADRAGRAHEVAAGDYARALERLHQLELIPVVLAGKQHTHPHLYDRLLAGGVEPSYPRPKPPSGGGAPGLLMVLPLVMGIILLIMLGTLLWPDTSTEAGIFWRMALTGGRGSALSDLALLRYQEGKQDEAVVFYRAASEVETDSPHSACNLAIVLANLNRCDEAEEAVRQATERWKANPQRGGKDVIELAEDAVRQCRSREKKTSRTCGDTFPEQFSGLSKNCGTVAGAHPLV